jgi:hypothetical protein
MLDPRNSGACPLKKLRTYEARFQLENIESIKLCDRLFFAPSTYLDLGGFIAYHTSIIPIDNR